MGYAYSLDGNDFIGHFESHESAVGFAVVFANNQGLALPKTIRVSEITKIRDDGGFSVSTDFNEYELTIAGQGE